MKPFCGKLVLLLIFFYIIISDMIKSASTIKSKLEKLKNYCIGSKIHLGKFKTQWKDMTEERKLELFKRANCPPVVLIPGFLGSKLEFRMKNCEEFQKYHQNIMESCGWTDCHDQKLQRFQIWAPVHIDYSSVLQNVLFGGHVKEKGPYIPNLIREVKFGGNSVTKNSNRKECFGNLLRVYYKRNHNETTLYDIEGLRGAEIKVQDERNAECGADVISNLLGVASAASREYQGYAQINEYFQQLGYTHGISLFNYPYDYRLPLQHSIQDLHKTVQLAYKITKKKPVLIGHSLGGLLAYKYSLTKQRLLQEVITVGSPFMGAPEAVQLLLTPSEDLKMDKKLNIFGYKVKMSTFLDKESLSMLHYSLPLTFYFPKDISHDKIDNYLLDAVAVEKHRTDVNDKDNMLLDFHKYLYNIFPHSNEKCFSISHSNPKHVCRINYVDYFRKPTFIFNSGKKFILKRDLDNFYSSKIREMVLKLNKGVHKEFVIEPESFEKYTKAYENLFSTENSEDHFPNPGIPFTFIYSNHIPTKIQSGEAGQTKYHGGDGKIPSFSEIYPGLRWLTEKYFHKDDHLYKYQSPIHFVEYCVNNPQKPMEDYSKGKDQYIALKCDCLDHFNKLSNKECAHASMINDSYIGMFLMDVLTKSKSYPIEIEEYEDLFHADYNRDMKCSNKK